MEEAAGNVSCDAEQIEEGKAKLMKLMYGYVETIAVKSAVELRIADIIQKQGKGKAVSLSQIASGIGIHSLSPNLNFLSRLMRLLVRMRVFTVTKSSTGTEPLFGLSSTSKWLVHDDEQSLAPLMLISGPDSSEMSPHKLLSATIKEGGTPFGRANGGHTVWEKIAQDPAFIPFFYEKMALQTKCELNAILDCYKHGFDEVRGGTLVDVAGGIGTAIAMIVKAHPEIRGINYDLPHVVAAAPHYPGVTHVGGDMFAHVPDADAVFIKSVMHDWGDEECIRILKNCIKAVSKKKGKVIISEIVLDPEGKGLFEDTKLAFDLLMMSFCDGAKERTEDEWSKLLKEAGFTHYNIINIPSMHSIIEAHTQ